MGKCLSKPRADQRNIAAPTEFIAYDDTIEFIPPITSGFVIKVYDGDTITIAARLPGTQEPIYRFSVRLSGIDTPEIKSVREAEKSAAHRAQEALSQLILHKEVTLKNKQNEKYGRILADVYLNDLHLNKWMLDQHYAVPYDGKTKVVVEDWQKYREQRLLGPSL